MRQKSRLFLRYADLRLVAHGEYNYAKPSLWEEKAKGEDALKMTGIEGVA